MNWLASIFVGVCAAILAAIITGTAADFWSKWLQVSSREGAAGFWVVWIAVLGGVVGLILGLSIARGWLLASPNFASALGATLGLTAAATLLITGFLWLATDHAPSSEVAGSAPPPLTPAQQEAAGVAQKEAELRALAPDAPLAQWLVFTRYGTPEPLIDAAIAAIRARPDYVAAMTHEMLEGEHDASRDALNAIEHIQPPAAELVPGVAEVGRRIAQSLRDLEKEAPGGESYDAHVAEVSTRFSAWMTATRVLQEAKVADFVPQLQEIIEPARRLDQAYAIRIDIVRVASFYLHKWAGIAPLPGDPPPR